MKVAIMQPYFLPYIGYFQLLNEVDKFVILDDVNFIKKGWINRNNLLVNGKEFLFSIPLKKVSQNKKINQIDIDNDLRWIKQLLKTVTLSYKRAPFFDEVYPIIEKILLNDERNLAKFIADSLRIICDLWSIETVIVLSSELDKNNDLKGQDRIIEICKKLEADSYINAIGGTELYDKNIFLKNKISLNFIKTNQILYKQFKHEFIPWLSIVDIMMFNSPELIKIYLKQGELI